MAGEIAAKTVAVIGCGPIGLFCIAVARACGASEVYALEINDHRRKLAAKMKADHVLNPAKDNVYEQVMDATGGTGVDVILEMSGHPMRFAWDSRFCGWAAELHCWGFHPSRWN